MAKIIHDKEMMDRLEGMSVPWEKNKEEVYKELEARIGDKKLRRIPIIEMRWIRSAAAIGIILISSVLFLRFYEKNLESSQGEFLTHQLPDGSVVELNSASNMSYNPYWWKIRRKLNFEGDAYFMVQKGSKFIVESDKASTIVLGTSFNIYSREDNYRVICHTGKVQVISNSANDIQTLEPNQEAELIENGNFQKRDIETLPDPVPWKNRHFEYTGTSLDQVLNELERQYDVEIIYPDKLDYFYTGDLDINRDFETSLNLVCKPFKITFEKVSESVYKLILDPDKNN